MNILFLGPPCFTILQMLNRTNNVVQTEEKIDILSILPKPDFIISYGYKHILSKEVVSEFKGRAINLHISYLPYNKGADPNFWSWFDDTPKGVTIHEIDEGIDTGKIIVQKLVKMGEYETLSTSYVKLKNEIEELFIENWDVIKMRGVGTYHKKADLEQHKHLLTKGWDTPVYQIQQSLRESPIFNTLIKEVDKVCGLSKEKE